MEKAMWHKPKLLNWTANGLFAVAIGMMLYATVYALLHLPIFPIKEIKVDGKLSHVTREQIRLIAERHLKGNFFTLNLARTRDAFEKLPWARKVSVRRLWPDQIVVVIEEHEALGRWGNVALVNTYGELFHAASDDDLPQLYGPADGVLEVAKAFVHYGGILKQANFNIAQISLSRRGAWDVKTSQGMSVALGRVDMDRRLSTFVKSYNNTLQQLNIKIDYADLRYPNGFAVRKPKSVIEKKVVKTSA
jgi:cell division protein FtsQ